MPTGSATQNTKLPKVELKGIITFIGATKKGGPEVHISCNKSSFIVYPSLEENQKLNLMLFDFVSIEEVNVFEPVRCSASLKLAA